MKFKILNDISFKEGFVKLLVILSMAIGLIVPVASQIIYSHRWNQAAKEQKKEVYALVNDHLLKLYLTEIDRPLSEIQVKGHLKRFSELFFDFIPNVDLMTLRFEEMKVLGDNSIILVRKEFENDDYWRTMVAGEYTAKLIMDYKDIEVDFTANPVRFKFNGKLEIIRRNDVVVKNVVSIGTIRDLRVKVEKKGRVGENVYGMWIENFEVVEFSDFEIKEKS